MAFTDKVKSSGSWSDKIISGVPEVDFVFSDGVDFVFSDGRDFVFREATAVGVWSDKVKT